MDDLPDVTITGDYTGALDAGQLPMDIAVKRFDGTTNVSASSTWTSTVLSGDVTCTIGAATGVLNVTAITTNSVVLIESTKDGLTLRKKQALNVKLSDPPNVGSSGGGGSSAWSDTTLSSTSSTTMAAISDDLNVTVGSSGTVDLSAPLYVRTTPNSTSEIKASLEVYGRWQWFDSGTSTWTDLGAGETASDPDCDVQYDAESGSYFLAQIGSLSVSASKTGLTPGNSEKFRLMARNITADVTMTYSGNATATTS
jgi:hypothetical protein